MMHTVINDVNCFPNKLLAVVMFELPLCSQVQWLENAVATEGGDTIVTFFTYHTSGI